MYTLCMNMTYDKKMSLLQTLPRKMFFLSYTDLSQYEFHFRCWLCLIHSLETHTAEERKKNFIERP